MELSVGDHFFEKREYLSLLESDVCLEGLGQPKGRSSVNPAFANLDRELSDQRVDLKVLCNGSGEKIRCPPIFDREWEDELLLLPKVIDGALLEEGEKFLRLLEELLNISSGSQSKTPGLGQRMVVIVR